MNVNFLGISWNPDWVSAIGQATGALFTAIAVAVALWIALRESREIRRSELNRARAQARLVLVETEFHRMGFPNPETQNDLIFGAEVRNLSNTVITDVTIQVWVISSEPGRIQPKTYPSYMARTAAILIGERPNNTYHFQFEIRKERPVIAGWRVFWSDPEGFLWERSSQHVDTLFKHDDGSPYLEKYLHIITPPETGPAKQEP